MPTSHSLPRKREQIPEDEQLFRAITKGDVAGSEVLVSAVDLQGTSVYREKYLDRPEDTFRFVPSDFTGLAVVTPGGLPEPIRNPNDEDIVWECFAFDDPDIDDSGAPRMAHAEIRFRRTSDRPDEENKRPKKAVKRELEIRLAQTMRVFLQPE